MQDETMVVLAEYNTITEAEIAKSMLDSAGTVSYTHLTLPTNSLV